MTIFIHTYGDQYGYVLIFAAPSSFQEDTIYIYVGVVTTLEGAVAPNFYMFIGFFVEVANRTWGHFGST